MATGTCKFGRVSSDLSPWAIMLVHITVTSPGVSPIDESARVKTLGMVRFGDGCEKTSSPAERKLP